MSGCLKSSHEKLSPSLTLQLEAPVPPQVAGHKVALAVVAAVQAVQNQKWCPGKPTRLFWGLWWQSVEAIHNDIAVTEVSFPISDCPNPAGSGSPLSHLRQHPRGFCQFVRLISFFFHRCHQPGFNAGWKAWTTWSHHGLSRGFYVFILWIIDGKGSKVFDRE